MSDKKFFGTEPDEVRLAVVLMEKAFFLESSESRLVLLEKAFEDAIKERDDGLCVRIIHHWCVQSGIAKERPGEEVEKAALPKLEGMFMKLAGLARERGAPMAPARLAVFKAILGLWHPWHTETSAAAFDFCAAAIGDIKQPNDAAKDDWTPGMRMLYGTYVPRGERDQMSDAFKDRANSVGFDDGRLEIWLDRYASVHYYYMTIPLLSTACARKGGTHRARREARQRQACKDFDVEKRSRAAWALQQMLMKGVKRIDEAMDHFRHFVGKGVECMEDDTPDADRWTVYGVAEYEYPSPSHAVIRVRLPDELRREMYPAMRQRADKRAGDFYRIFKKEISVKIEIIRPASSDALRIQEVVYGTWPESTEDGA